MTTTSMTQLSPFVESTSVHNIWPRTQFGFPWFSVLILISFLIDVYLPLSSSSFASNDRDKDSGDVYLENN